MYGRASVPVPFCATVYFSTGLNRIDSVGEPEISSLALILHYQCWSLI